MMLALVSLPHDRLQETQNLWLPLVERVSRRGQYTTDELVARMAAGENQLHLIWDPEAKQARALVVTRIFLRGGRNVAEVLWCTGSARKTWLPLLADLERYFREQWGCVGMNAVARFGWADDLKAQGYKATHMVWEKNLAGPV